MPRYRLTQTAYLKPHPSSPVPILIDEGAEVDLPEYPGPYAMPLDLEAKQRRTPISPRAGSATLDPTRRLSPQLADGASPQTLDQVVQHQLDNLLRAAGRTPLPLLARTRKSQCCASQPSPRMPQLMAAMSAQPPPRRHPPARKELTAMIFDANTLFSAATGDAITASAASTNVLDLVSARDLGADVGLDQLELVANVLAGFTSGSTNTTLNVQLQAAPDNGSGAPGGYETITETSPQYLGQLVAGQRVFQAKLPSFRQTWFRPVATTFSCSSGACTITVASATGIQLGMPVVPAIAGIIVPGTTVTGISGTTITLSANTTAAASAGSAIAFQAADPLPRFLRLNYVVANGPFTGGTLWAGIVLDSDAPILYPTSFQAFPTGQ